MFGRLREWRREREKELEGDIERSAREDSTEAGGGKRFCGQGRRGYEHS